MAARSRTGPPPTATTTAQAGISTRPALADLDGDGSIELAVPLREAGEVLILGRVATRYAPDCDSSGVPDDCDLALGRSPDCDGNLIPDECDLLPRIDFAPSPPNRTRGLARVVETADIDGDGHLDLVRVEPPLGVSVLWGRGASAFEEPAVVSPNGSLRSAAALDIDADGDLDLAAGDVSEDTIVILFQAAARSFAEGGEFISQRRVHAGALAAGDLDGDGDPDLAALNGSNAGLSVARNDGGGSFRVVQSLAGAKPPILRFADLDGDGRPDALSSGHDSPLAVFWNSGGWLGEQQPVSGRGPLDGDGDVDIAGSTSGGFTIAFQEDGRSFRIVEAFTGEPGPRGVAAADMDLDGDVDLAALPAGEGRTGILVFRNGGPGRFGAHFALAHAAGRLDTPIVAGDHDGDGRVDLVVERERECPACPAEPAALAVLNRTLPAAALDVDGNRIPDGCQGGSFRRGDAGGDGALDLGDAVLTLRFLFQGGPAPGCAEAADADNDGKTDLADPILVLDHLFHGGPPPAAPGPPPGPCGLDPDPPGSPGDLGCENYGACLTRPP